VEPVADGRLGRSALRALRETHRYGTSMATIFDQIFNGMFKHPDGSWAWWKIAIFLRSRGDGQPRIKGPALTGTARILSLESTGPSSDSGPVCKIGLRVEILGHPPCDLTIRRHVHVNHVPRQPGMAIPVQVDPTDPKKVLIDFNQPIMPPQA
jgi:hypothetical protein